MFWILLGFVCFDFPLSFEVLWKGFFNEKEKEKEHELGKERIWEKSGRTEGKEYDQNIQFLLNKNLIFQN